MTSAEYRRLMAYLTGTRTRVRRARDRLAWAKANLGPTQHELHWLIGFEAERLMEEMLDAAEELVPLVTDLDRAETLRKKSQNVTYALRRASLAAKLSNVEGRTPEEAAAFEAKAKEMTG